VGHGVPTLWIFRLWDEVQRLGCKSRACCFFGDTLLALLLLVLYFLALGHEDDVCWRVCKVFYLGGSSATPSGTSRLGRLAVNVSGGHGVYAWDECFLSPRYKYPRLTPSCETSSRLARFSMLGQSGGS